MKRTVNLIKYLEVNCEALLHEVDPEGLELYKTNSSVVAASAIDDSLDDVGGSTNGAKNYTAPLLGGAWGEELRSLTWMPAFTKPPVKNKVQPHPPVTPFSISLSR